MDAYGNAVIDERIRYEVDEQTRGLLHHSKATHATIRKCVSRTIGKKLQQEASEVSNHSSIQPRRSVNSNMGKNNNNDNEENFTYSNNDLDTNNSAIASAIFEKQQVNRKRSVSPFDLLSSKDRDASEFMYSDAPISSPILPEKPEEIVAHVRQTNRSMRKSQSDIFPPYERLYRTRKETKIVAEVSHPNLYIPPNEKQEKIRKMRIERLRKKEMRERAKSAARLLGASASMISSQYVNEKVREDRNKHVGEKLKGVEAIKRKQRYVKRRLDVLQKKKKKEKKLLIQRNKTIVNKMLRRNARKEENRRIRAKNNTHMLRRTSKGSYEMVDVINPKTGTVKYKKFIPKRGMRGMIHLNRSKIEVPSSIMCIDGYMLFTPEENADPRLIRTSTSQGMRVDSAGNNFLTYNEMFNPSTANTSGLAEGSSSEMYGPHQPWGGLTPIATPKNKYKKRNGKQTSLVIPSVSGAFSIGNETLSGSLPPVEKKKNNNNVGEIQMPMEEGWQPIPVEQTIEWGRVTSANNMISANGSLSRSSIHSQGSAEIPVRMDVSSPFNARRHYAKTTIKPLSPAFRSTSSRDNSSMHDTVIGNLPAPWGHVREEHMVSRGPIFKKLY